MSVCREQEARKLKGERELETARLRARQERMCDERAELDALRARRAVEATERAWREKEKDRAARQARINATLVEARVQQQRDKERRIAEHASQEKADFLRIMRARDEAQAEEAATRERRREEVAQPPP